MIMLRHAARSRMLLDGLPPPHQSHGLARVDSCTASSDTPPPSRLRRDARLGGRTPARCGRGSGVARSAVERVVSESSRSAWLRCLAGRTRLPRATRFSPATLGLVPCGAARPLLDEAAARVRLAETSLRCCPVLSLCLCAALLRPDARAARSTFATARRRERRPPASRGRGWPARVAAVARKSQIAPRRATLTMPCRSLDAEEPRRMSIRLWRAASAAVILALLIRAPWRAPGASTGAQTPAFCGWCPDVG